MALRFDALAFEAVLTDDPIVNSKRPNANCASGRMLGLRTGQSVYLSHARWHYFVFPSSPSVPTEERTEAERLRHDFRG
jgi:hypothetical protein